MNRVAATSKIKGFCSLLHPFPSVTSHFPFIPATNLPQRFCALLHAKNHRSTVSLIDDSTSDSYAVRTSRLTRDGRSAIQVSHECYYVRNLIGVSCSPFLREFCDIQLLNPVHATNLPQRILATRCAQECGSHLDQHINRERLLSTSATAPHVRPVKGGPNSRTKLQPSPRDDKLACR